MPTEHVIRKSYLLTAECAPGYYCSGGAENNHQYDCPTGHECPSASKLPSPCQEGTYANSTNMETCIECPPGWYCVDAASQPLPCPEGYYCPLKTGYNWKACPQGLTFRFFTVN